MSDEIKNSIGPQDPPSSRNRAYDIRRDNDKFTIPSITIYDIDFTILSHIQENIRPQIVSNNRIIQVPVIMDNGEKWSQIQEFGYLRDKQGKIQSPIITLRRLSFAQDDRIPKLDLNGMNSANVLIYKSNKQSNSQYDFLNTTQNTKKSIEYFATVLPEHVRVQYELMIWTDMVEQSNLVLEKIWPQSRQPWGNELSFTTYVLDPSFETVNVAGEDRLVKCTIGLDVAAQLQQQHDMYASNIQKAYSPKRLVFQNDRSQYDINVDKDFPS